MMGDIEAIGEAGLDFIEAPQRPHYSLFPFDDCRVGADLPPAAKVHAARIVRGRHRTAQARVRERLDVPGM